MNYAYEIEKLNERLDSLQESFIQAQKNQVPVTAKVDDTSIRVDAVEQTMEDAIYPAWNPNGYDYYQGERVSYDGKLYRCIQNHKSQVDWTPDTAVSLWSEISDPSEEYPEWKQPQGAHDAYAKGDKVSHNDKHWTSDVDGNVWEPGVYGWSEV